jgi:hypothetical protein
VEWSSSMSWAEVTANPDIWRTQNVYQIIYSK